MSPDTTRPHRGSPHRSEHPPYASVHRHTTVGSSSSSSRRRRVTSSRNPPISTPPIPTRNAQTTPMAPVNGRPGTTGPACSAGGCRVRGLRVRCRARLGVRLRRGLLGGDHRGRPDRLDLGLAAAVPGRGGHVVHRARRRVGRGDQVRRGRGAGGRRPRRQRRRLAGDRAGPGVGDGHAGEGHPAGVGHVERPQDRVALVGEAVVVHVGRRSVLDQPQGDQLVELRVGRGRQRRRRAAARVVALAVAVFDTSPRSTSGWVTTCGASAVQVVVASGASVVTGQVAAPAIGSSMATPVRVVDPELVTRNVQETVSPTPITPSPLASKVLAALTSESAETATTGTVTEVLAEATGTPPGSSAVAVAVLVTGRRRRRSG